ncbi:hypothetical protein Droror1_Dr00024651 [Drosera rotundifolia]
MIDITWLSAVLVGAGCFALGYYIGVRLHVRPLNSGPKYKYALPKNSKKDGTPLTLEVERLADILEDFKMVLVVRNDLKMGKGKIAAQCSHATLGLYKKTCESCTKSSKQFCLCRWEMCGQVKVVLKTETEDDMLVLQIPELLWPFLVG